MTDKPTPTDTELKAMWRLHAADIGGIFYYARAVLAKWGQPAKPDPAYSAACHLATALFKKHFAHLPDFASGQAVWSLCDSTAGVISQIDNMVAGLVQPPTPTPQAADTGAAQGAGITAVDLEPLQIFDSPRAKALMRAFEEGWAACRDAEFVGEDAQNDAFNQSATVNVCMAEDWTAAAPPADSVLEDAARWNAWASGMVEACNSDEQEPAFLVALDKAIGDAEPPITLELLNEWTDIARGQGVSQ